LLNENINIENLTTTNKAATSVASVVVDQNGKYEIVLNFGAIYELTIDDLDRAEVIIKNSKFLLTSLMIKPEVALHALKLAKKHNCIYIKFNSLYFIIYFMFFLS
jgi:ribokinase